MSLTILNSKITIFNLCRYKSIKLICIEVYGKSRGFSLASPLNIVYITQMLIIDWSVTCCDVTADLRILPKFLYRNGMDSDFDNTIELIFSQV